MRVVYFAVAVDLVSHEGSNDINEVLDGANRVIGVRVVHVAHLVQDSKKIIVSIAVLQIDTHVLHIATSQVNSACFGGNGSRVKWHIVLHLNRLLLEGVCLQTEQLYTLLVPLERVQALRQLRSKTALDVVIHSKVSFNHIGEVTHNLVCVFVQKSLKLAHLLVVIEVLFILGVQLSENVLEVLQCLNKL